MNHHTHHEASTKRSSKCVVPIALCLVTDPAVMYKSAQYKFSTALVKFECYDLVKEATNEGRSQNVLTSMSALGIPAAGAIGSSSA